MWFANTSHPVLGTSNPLPSGTKSDPGTVCGVDYRSGLRAILASDVSASRTGSNTSRQRKGDIRSGYGRLQRGMACDIVRICGRLRSSTEHNIFTSIDLIDRRHTFQPSLQFRLPQDFAGRRIESSYLTVARARENQTPCRQDGTD